MNFKLHRVSDESRPIENIRINIMKYFRNLLLAGCIISRIEGKNRPHFIFCDKTLMRTINMSRGSSLSAEKIRTEMARIRRLFYLGMIVDSLCFLLLGAVALYLFPSKAGLFGYLAISMSLILWHQSSIRRQLNCPICHNSLYEWDGITLHPKTCSHCGAELR